MMRKAMAVLLGFWFLSGCGGEQEAKSKAAEDAEDVAMVERMNRTPFKPIRPEPFTSDDLDRYDLGRAGCVFRPGENPQEPPLFVTQQDRGYIKIAGRLQPLAAKAGSAELPAGARSTYVGLDNWIELVSQAGPESSQPAGTQAWPSRLVIHDAEERVAFDSRGHVFCREE